MVDRRFRYFNKQKDPLKTMDFEINLKHELYTILNDEKRSKWYIYRRVDRDTPVSEAEGFLPFYGTNPNGHDYEYTDELHRGFMIPQNTLSLLRRTEAQYGFGEPYQPFTFFVFKHYSQYRNLRYNLDPKAKDVIYEIDYSYDIPPDIVENLSTSGRLARIAPPFVYRFDIKNISSKL